VKVIFRHQPDGRGIALTLRRRSPLDIMEKKLLALHSAALDDQGQAHAEADWHRAAGRASALEDALDALASARQGR
jgi:hypothetical protein